LPVTALGGGGRAEPGKTVRGAGLGLLACVGVRVRNGATKAASGSGRTVARGVLGSGSVGC